MAESPIITTPRLRIVPFSEEHLTTRYVNWLNDPEVVRYSEQRHHQHTPESCRQYWKSFIASPHYFWAIIVTNGDLGHIGNMNAYVDLRNSVCDLGILIGQKAAWNRGYGFEAWVAVCGYLLRNVGMRKVAAGCLSVNEGMLSIMKRAGMVEDGRRLRHYLCEGREVDVVHAALFKE
jgi:ribosomal-protein-alanine N-acetyltransferase